MYCHCFSEFDHACGCLQLLSLDLAFPASQSRDGFSRHGPGQQAAAAAAIPGQDPHTAAAAASKSRLDASSWDLTGLHNPPWDWSVKTRVKIASQERLKCLVELAEGQSVQQGGVLM